VKGRELLWERAAEAAGNEEKRRSLRLCLSARQSGGTRLDLAELLSFVRRQRRDAKSTLKRLQFTTRRPVRPENA
jgi:hypothetical protein